MSDCCDLCGTDVEGGHLPRHRGTLACLRARIKAQGIKINDPDNFVRDLRSSVQSEGFSTYLHKNVQECAVADDPRNLDFVPFDAGVGTAGDIARMASFVAGSFRKAGIAVPLPKNADTVQVGRVMAAANVSYSRLLCFVFVIHFLGRASK